MSEDDDREIQERRGETSGAPPAKESVSHRRVLLAFFEDGYRAEVALSSLMELDFPLDRVSVVGRVSAAGDDPLGISYSDIGERMRGWGGLGLLWGGILGLLSGGAGLFLLPGFGTVMAAGPLVQSIAGGTVGAAAGGTLMAGAGAAAQITVAIHRMGIPEHCLEEIHARLERGEHLLMLILSTDDVENWQLALREHEPEEVWDLPYTGLVEGIQEAL